jgi:Ras family protein A
LLKKKVELILWDTSGQDYYERIRSLNYPETNAILMCYSIDNIDSFTNIALKWYDELREHFAKTPIILVGK